jgi:hypothetical protein
VYLIPCLLICLLVCSRHPPHLLCQSRLAPSQTTDTLLPVHTTSQLDNRGHTLTSHHCSVASPPAPATSRHSTMFVIKATLKDETRRLTFEGIQFPSFEHIQNKVSITPLALSRIPGCGMLWYKSGRALAVVSIADACTLALSTTLPISRAHLLHIYTRHYSFSATSTSLRPPRSVGPMPSFSQMTHRQRGSCSSNTFAMSPSELTL